MASKKTSGGRPTDKGKKPGAKAKTPQAAKGSAAGGKASKRPPDNKAKNPKKKK